MIKILNPISVAQTGNIPLKETLKRVRERSQIEKDKVAKTTRLRVLSKTHMDRRGVFQIWKFSEERLGK
jgi:hypothetical protein